MTDIVLLHGTAAGHAGYEWFSAALERRGWTAHGVDLPTDRPQLGVQDYAALVGDGVGVDVDAPVVLGHSGAGLLVEAVGSMLRARHLVWLAAYIPAEGTSLMQESATALFGADWVGVDPTSDDAAAAYFLYHDCDYPTLRWALRTGRLWYPDAAYRQPGARRHTPAPPATVVVASQDRVLRPGWCRRAARERLGVTPVEIDSGHCPHVSQPDILADVVVSAVSGATANTR